MATDDASPEETENTVSSASLCMSPASVARGEAPSPSPLCTSTPFGKCVVNGHDAADGAARDRDADLVNGNVNVNIVSESNYSIDVLSGGESEAGDTLRRENNNNSISSNLTHALRDGTLDTAATRGADLSYFIAKELLMTERTYKRDLELVTVTWSGHVSQLAADAGSGGAGEAAAALARACLALEPLALACGALLARLERALAAHKPQGADDDEPEYRKVPELLHDYLLSTYDEYERYIENAGPLVGLVENVRRCQPAAGAACAAFEAASPLPLAALLLRPLHRAARYRALAAELCASGGGERAAAALEAASRLAAAAGPRLPPAENHAALCQLRRHLAGYDKLLVADREFIRLGCVYKHSTKGLQQRMLFLFSDVLLVCSRAGAQFRAAYALPLHKLNVRDATLPHSIEIEGDNVHLLLSTSNEQEYVGWKHALTDAVTAARDNPVEVDTELTPVDQDTDVASIVPAGACIGALSQVCWHRAASLSRAALHCALQRQQSGYLLRKFKKSVGWQRLWVVWAARALHFYKTWRDAAPLALLPLLGYTVSAPAAADGVDKEFVFKLQFKNHVYFFRADSSYTYNKWIEVLQSPPEHYEYD